MEQKKQTNIMLKPSIHVRLKMAAALMGMSLGDLVAYLLERHFPLRTIEDSLYFARGIKEQEEEKKQCL